MKLAIAISLATLFCATCHGTSIFEQNFQALQFEPPFTPSLRAAADTSYYVVQKVDNFNNNDARTWNMRYLSNNEFAVAGGPIFIYVGGEWTANSAFIRAGHFYDMAREHKAYLFATEHRYYGQSHPTSDLKTENLQYLTVQQALADLAVFINFVKSSIPGLQNSKVVLAGGSYSATMVTWFKRLYPNMVSGVWASSAPLLAKVNYKEYTEVVGQSIKRVGGDNCYNRIRNAYAQLESMISDQRAGQVKQILNICNNFDTKNSLDVASLFSSIFDMFAGIIQNHNNGDIQNACAQIMKGNNDVNGLANYVLSKYGSSNCIDYSYQRSVSSIKNTNYSSSSHRQWTYQTCNQFGWYRTSDSPNQPFGTKIPEALSIARCRDAFSQQFTSQNIHRNINNTNTYFGGKNPGVQNVYFTNGQLDPWHPMGIPDNKGTVIPLLAHCKDFGSISQSDSPELRASKQRLAQLVRSWLAK